MIHLKSQSLKNIVYFKDESVRFDENPITFVRGLNLDADPAAPTGNGAGKSLLLSCPSNVFYFSPPLAIKRKAKKELLGKGSSITQTLVASDGHTYEVTQTAIKYTIKRDGEDLGIRTVPLAERFIQTKLFPITELVYYSTCYVTTQRPFRMQTDSDSDRLNHLSSMFQLDDYDHMKRYFLDKIGEIRESELKLQVLERDLLEVRANLKKLKRKTEANGELDIAALKAERAKAEETLAGLVKEEFNTKTTLSNLNTLLTVELELDALRSSYTDKRKPADYAKHLKRQLKLARAWATYQELKEAYDSAVGKAQRKLAELEKPEVSREAAVKTHRKFTNALEDLKAKRSDLNDAKRRHDRLESAVEEALSEVKELGYSRKKGPDMDVNHDDAIAECRTTLRLSKLLKEHNHEDGKCPTCLGDVDLDSIRSLVKSATKRLPALEKEKEAQAAWTAYKAAKTKLDASEFDPEELEAVVKRIEAAGPAIAKLQETIELWDKRESYERVLSSVKKPERPEERVEDDLTVEQIEVDLELCEDITKHLSARTKLIESNEALFGLRTAGTVRAQITEMTEHKHRVTSAVKRLRTELEGIVNKLDSASGAQHEHEVHHKRKKDLVARIEKLRPRLEDKRLFEVLVKAYSTKGLKTLVADQICGLLEQNLNAYSNLIFNEPFVFTVSATDGGMSITVDRHNGVVSDVRNLSGAESNAFRLLFVFSLLPLLPSDMRTNMLTLDEPCAHMDEVSRQKFLHLFLPALAEIVPHIYIITPNADDYCEGSEQWVVKKENGKSSVIKGAPMDLPHQNVAELVAKVKKGRRKKAAK